MVDNDQNIAQYVLHTLNRAFHDVVSDDNKVGIKWRQKVVEAPAVKLKSMVKTFVLEWNWAKQLMRSSQMQAISNKEAPPTCLCTAAHLLCPMRFTQVLTSAETRFERLWTSR